MSELSSSAEPKRNRKKKNNPTKGVEFPSLPSEMAVYEAERQRLAREVHDRIGQPLTALKIMVDRSLTSREKNSELLEEALALIMEMQTEVRKLCVSLESAPELPPNIQLRRGG